MSTVQEIEAAIRALSDDERAKLVEHLPEILPELDGDREWQRIIRGTTPRPALSALGDSVMAALSKDPNAFPEIRESDFDRRQ